MTDHQEQISAAFRNLRDAVESSQPQALRERALATLRQVETILSELESRTDDVKVTMYCPPSGERIGFPKEYKRAPNESFLDVLFRDGYPRRNIYPDGTDRWGKSVEEQTRFWSEWRSKKN